MVKADVKHNYYADLELPANASIEDVRKAYRKLALQYHPDRNAGREEECVPKFQAIQSAIEILGEPSSKQKYDADRKRAGIQPLGQTFNPRQPGPGNPYAANTSFAPPPRRTQPGTWQRPNQAAGATPNGADRFSNFPRPAPTARNPTQDRTEQFKAWQNVQGQARPKPSNVPPQQGGQPQAQTHRQQRPQPPPRNVPPGFNYEQNQTAWQTFKDANAGKPGMPRTAPGATPRKQGFNPNVPGSDEKPADSTYFHRKHSDDLGRSNGGMKVPPPPSGPPPGSTPASPMSPTSRRPYPDPTRPYSSRAPNDQVPFAEGNRDRTPYASFIRERTDLGDGLRRSHSTRDTSKLGPEDAARQNRARSTSPLRRQRASEGHAPSNSQSKAFNVGYGSSESSENASPSAAPGENKSRPGTAPNTAPPFDRPRKVPTPPSSRFNGTRSGPNSPPPMPGMPNINGFANGAHSGAERPSTQQQPSSNMYEPLFPSSDSRPKSTRSRNSDSTSTSRARSAWSTVGRWAIPSSVNPYLRAQPIKDTTYVTAADEVYKAASKDEKSAFLHFQANLEKWFEYIPDNFDMEVFLKLASTARTGTSCGDPLVDRLLNDTLSHYSTVGQKSNNYANGKIFGDRFHFPHDDDMFTPTNSKSRSEENINMQFAEQNFDGKFGASNFAPPPSSGHKTSPTRRSTRTPKEQSRSATMDVPNTPAEGVSQRPWGSDGRPKEFSPSDAPVGGFQDQWQNQNPFWPPPPPQKPGSPTKSGTAGQSRKPSQGRRTSKPANRSTTGAKSQQQPHVVDVDEDDTVDVQGADGKVEHGAPVMEEPEPMDIDNTPPPHTDPQSARAQNEARLYNVPRSTRQEQELKQQSGQRHRKTSSASRKQATTSNLKTNLDDLRNVEPISKSADAAGTYNFGDMSANLPFQSQAAPALSDKIIKPNKLNMPQVPKPPAEPTKLTKTSWVAYVHSYGAYVKAFHDFNKAMIEHFAAREQLTDMNFSDPTRWLEAAGDTSGLLGASTGFGTYLAMTQEDEGVREHWNVGCEKHTASIQAFGKVRERMKKLAEGGGLVNG